jgi:hypothetical protein
MKMSLHELDLEIAEIEARIAAERVALEDAVTGCTNSLRDTVSSPKTLLALTGIGFAVGKVMFGRKAPPTVVVAKKTGMLGVLTGVAGTAIGLMQPKFGVGTLARWAAGKYFSKGKAPQAATVVKPAAPLRSAPARGRTPAGV